ncbi:CRISPR-associated endonuclease Cas1, partial [Candidatus Micrarchaeota archaeon CG_4_10_14_0_8_um_filter_60_7]
MDVILNEYGTFLGKKGEVFQIKNKEQTRELAAGEVDQIIVAAPSSVSYDAVQLAIEKDIDIVYLDWRGMPIARVYPCRLGGTTLTRRKQLEAYSSEA